MGNRLNQPEQSWGALSWVSGDDDLHLAHNFALAVSECE